VVGANGAVKWPNGKHSICGDDAHKRDQPFMKPGPIAGEQQKQQLIHFAYALPRCIMLAAVIS
jgi:hypothetical protein